MRSLVVRCDEGSHHYLGETEVKYVVPYLLAKITITLAIFFGRACACSPVTGN